MVKYEQPTKEGTRYQSTREGELAISTTSQSSWMWTLSLLNFQSNVLLTVPLSVLLPLP